MNIEQTIFEALERLDLPRLITRDDIKRRYRQLVRVHHPDLPGGDRGVMESINAAYALLMTYMDSFRYAFDSEEITRQYPGEAHAKKFTS